MKLLIYLRFYFSINSLSVILFVCLFSWSIEFGEVAVWSEINRSSKAWIWGGCSLKPNQPVQQGVILGNVCNFKPNQPVQQDTINRWRYRCLNFGSFKSCRTTSPILRLKAARIWYLGLLRAAAFQKKKVSTHILSTFSSIFTAVIGNSASRWSEAPGD